MNEIETLELWIKMMSLEWQRQRGISIESDEGYRKLIEKMKIELAELYLLEAMEDE